MRISGSPSGLSFLNDELGHVSEFIRKISLFVVSQFKRLGSCK